MPVPTYFYASLGEALTAHTLDLDSGELTPRSTVSLPAMVQYAWRHPREPVLYVASSNGRPGKPGDVNHLSAFLIGEDGALSPHGTPLELPARPIHCTVDREGVFALVSYNQPSLLTVHRINVDATLGEEVPQDPDLDFDVYSHQVLVSPGNQTVLMPARGNDSTGTREADTGCLKMFAFDEGRLSPLGSITPYPQFGPRHLAFHPNGRWAYLSVERQSELQTYELGSRGELGPEPRFSTGSLSRPVTGPVRQIACAVHVHPNGQFVYQSNRSDGFAEHDGWRIGHRGEDSITVYAIDQHSGEATPIQHEHVPSVHVRTFSIHPDGGLLVAATIQPVPVRTDDGGVRVIPAALMVYRIGDDGRLTLLRTYEINTLGKWMFWTGMVSGGQA